MVEFFSPSANVLKIHKAVLTGRYIIVFFFFEQMALNKGSTSYDKAKCV